jgi:hypothetical protein
VAVLESLSLPNRHTGVIDETSMTQYQD